jgi:hypothetical protein
VIAVETERLMRNWALWKYSGSSISAAMSSAHVAMTSAYSLEARGSRSGVSMPLFDAEALDVDQAVGVLPEPLKLVVAEYWLRKGTTMQKVRRCRCAVATFYRRLGHAHSRIHLHLSGLRQRRMAVSATVAPSQIPLRG